MASYVGLIRQDVFYHKSCEDMSSWPRFVSQLVKSLQHDLKLPGCQLGPDAVPHSNERVLDEPRVSDDASRNDLWDDTNRIPYDVQRRLHGVFDTALVDCARIRAVCKAERATGTTSPKQSFLAILVRNSILSADPGLCLLDDVPVILPRHFSGEAIPILKYMTKSFLAPLIISICEELPIQEGDSDSDYEPSDVNKDETEICSHCPVTMSELLDECHRPIIHEEQEQVETSLPPQFEAYFIACSSSTAPPSICHIPIFCMGDKDQLPVMMSSFLYQRRVWRINDPLVGVEFSKYDTTIRLYLGWLEDDVSSDRVLPRVHLAEIGTPVALDLSSPQVALAVSRALGGLEPHISGVRDTVKQFAGAVVSGTRSHSPLSWRIDADIPQQDLGSNLSRDMAVFQWAESQRHLGYEETMPPRKKVGKQPSQKPTSTKASDTTSARGNLSIPEIQEPYEKADDSATLRSFSCSAFAAASEQEEYRVFRWLFDRQVVLQCIPSDLEFREKYKAMTGFIWPETWHVRQDLPPVDAALEPFVQELMKDVVALETRPNAVNRIPVEDFPVDLRILEQSFSAIFQASRRSREKKGLQESVFEASWRVDHDRLLFDFFIRLVRPSDGSAMRTLTDQPVAHLEDPCTRPTLETTLRLPKSNFVKQHLRTQRSMQLSQLVLRQTPDLANWVLNYGGSESQYIAEAQNIIYVASKWSQWMEANKRETEPSTVSVLRRLPSTGRCDALGRLLVELPNIASDDIDDFQLVVRAVRQKSTLRGEIGSKKSRAGTNLGGGESSTRILGDSLSLPDVSAGAATRNGTRYNIPSTSISSSAPPLVDVRTPSTNSMDALACEAQKLHIGTDRARLELPILTVEYKKASDNGVKGTNQSRMYLTAAVKFLEAVGITNIPVYGMLTDGPVAVFPAAILRDDGFVYMFERLVERIDISTALGAWHYATILCRLAHDHAKLLETKFEEVKEDLVTRLRESKQGRESWTLEQQLAELTTENREK